MSFFLKRLTRKKHSTGSTQSTSKLLSVSGSYIEDFPAASSFQNEDTRSNNNSSSASKKIFNNVRSPKTQLVPAPLTPKRTPSPRVRRSTEASIVDLEAKLRELSGSVDPGMSVKSVTASVKSAVPVNDSFDDELRQLNPKTRRVITDELDASKGWKALAAEVNHPDRVSEKLFVDIQLLSDHKKVKSPSEEILKTWSTTGRNRPRIRDLYDVLVTIRQLKIAKRLMFDVLGTSVSLCIDDDSEEVALNSDRRPNDSFSDTTANFSNMKACLSNVYQICYDSVESATDHFSPMSRAKIAEGTFGIVYKVKIDGEDMAVKLFKEDIQQIANEIQQLSVFDHPNVLSLYGVAVGEDSLCMITKFMNNGSLQQMLASSVLDWPLRLRVLRDVTAGLKYVHSFNVIHRDVKPANILLDENMNALIVGALLLVLASRTGDDFMQLLPRISADFGLARKKSGFDTSRTNFAAGTSFYMAPETLYGRLVLVSDVYSFGVVALEVFTGLPVFDDKREEGLLTEHVRERSPHEVCDKRIAQPSDSIIEDCFKWIQLCLKHKNKERPDMEVTHQQFQTLFERVCEEDSN